MHRSTMLEAMLYNSFQPVPTLSVVEFSVSMGFRCAAEGAFGWMLSEDECILGPSFGCSADMADDTLMMAVQASQISSVTSEFRDDALILLLDKLLITSTVVSSEVVRNGECWRIMSMSR
jgi:hypothetical protein